MTRIAPKQNGGDQSQERKPMETRIKHVGRQIGHKIGLFHLIQFDYEGECEESHTKEENSSAAECETCLM